MFAHLQIKFYFLDMSESRRYQETKSSFKMDSSDAPQFQQSQFQNSGMRIIASETREMQPQTITIQKTLQTDYEIKNSQPRIQSQRARSIGGPQISAGFQPFQGFQGQTFQVQQNCQAAQPLCMNVIVVSKEEIEAPWRLECEYLQSLITELEKRKDTQIVEKVVEKVVTDNSRIDALEAQLRMAQGDRDQLQSQLRSLKNENGQLKGELSLRSGNEGRYSQLESEYSNMKQSLEAQIRALRSRNEELESSLRRAEGDAQRLQMSIRTKDDEIANLRNQLSSLQSNLQEANKYRDLELQIKMLKDEINRLEGLLSRANQENQDLRMRLSGMEQDSYSKNNELVMKIRDQENRISMLQNEVDRLNGLLRMREQELEDFRIRYEMLESQGTTVISEKVTYLSQEVEVWKQKFIKANHEYNRCQEELTMCQAELESLKKGGKKETVVTSQRVVTRTGGTTTTTTGGTQGGYLGVGGTGGYGGGSSSSFTRSEVTRKSGTQQP